MTRAPLVIVGCGGQGSEIHDVADAADEVEVAGCLDDSPSEHHRALVEGRGVKILGGIDWLIDAGPGIQGIAAPAVRHRVDAPEGNCPIEEEVLVGAQSCVLQGLTVGPGAVVGAAACVVRDVPAGRTVKGVQAR